MSAEPCTCGCAEPHVIMERQTADEARVCFWSDGWVTGPMGQTVIAKELRRSALFLLAEEAGLCDWREMKQAARVARKAVAQTHHRPSEWFRHTMAGGRYVRHGKAVWQRLPAPVPRLAAQWAPDPRQPFPSPEVADSADRFHRRAGVSPAIPRRPAYYPPQGGRKEQRHMDAHGSFVVIYQIGPVFTVEVFVPREPSVWRLGPYRLAVRRETTSLHEALTLSAALTPVAPQGAEPYGCATT